MARRLLSLQGTIRPSSGVVLLLSLLLLIVSDWLIHYTPFLFDPGCEFPEPERIVYNFERGNVSCAVKTVERDYVRTLILSDVHVLDPNVVWIDRLRRHRQMKTVFDLAVHWLEPRLIVFLGDQLDKPFSSVNGKFNIDAFKSLFQAPPHIGVISIVGNHDIGFHKQAKAQTRMKDYVAEFGRLDSLYNIRGIGFVELNSMGTSGDNCSLCQNTRNSIRRFSVALNEPEVEKFRAHPILITHFPLYRRSDTACAGFLDYAIERGDAFSQRAMRGAEEEQERYKGTLVHPSLNHSKHFFDGEEYQRGKENFYINEEDYEVITKSSTKLILDELKPRLVLSGHTHYKCLAFHENNIPEITVSTFNWRMRSDPSFLLMKVPKDSIYDNHLSVVGPSSCVSDPELNYLVKLGHIEHLLKVGNDGTLQTSALFNECHIIHERYVFYLYKVIIAILSFIFLRWCKWMYAKHKEGRGKGSISYRKLRKYS
eukprot:Nk52_evm29s2496 gene=Nk52_evmTU29s2496